MAVKGKKRKRTSTRVTLEDIARYCDVSKATVSRVLNDHLNEFPVSDEMITRVKNAATQLGYRPNRLARAIRNQRTNLIGLSFIHIDYQHLSTDQIAYENQVMGQFSNIILSHPGFKDYDLVIHDRIESADHPLKERDFKSDLLEGMIYLTPSDTHREFLDIASKEFPIVLLGQTEESEKKVPCIDINNRKMAQKAVEHLIETGCRNILILIPEKLQHISCIQDRIKGYNDALTKNGLPKPEEFVRTVRSLKENVEAFFKQLRCLDEIDAIFCPSDELAALCIAPLQSLGKKIPEDISLCGFDDMPAAQHTTPPITTVRRPVDKQAHAAIDLLLKILKKETPYEPGFHEIETELIIRKSTVKD
ncbi:LacI family DNA-binding transcriptional regulator [Tichowtungia aerotolerans]|uniref:Substrate-binding domain-containing protein n=1 Tax=Tichowtungia aerotolerans TaxID=2697043 RepID=A0A6P1MDP6_9BACT|nr:LacI family DNA-binding transcriptional regulator [Tichowtungia aerotolerans]QHI70684.1 substrate-binding domain-containing protein [Tichowtungia aerotolerans]